MRKILFTLVMVFFTVAIFAQKGWFPRISSSSTEKPISISKLKVDVEIIGGIVLTTYDLTFYNPNNRVMEGNLEFPLNEKESVVDYGIDINGKIRYASVVDKDKGREVFEEIVSRKVDPGLLEKSVGNNYKTRVYPIPARGTRQVVLITEQTIDKGEAGYQYTLPLTTKDKLEHLEINILVVNIKTPPIIDKSPFVKFLFESFSSGYSANFSASNTDIPSEISFSLPFKDKSTVLLKKSDKDIYYFYAIASAPEIANKNTASTGSSVKTLDILWDVSLSGLKRNTAKEVELVTQYLTSHPNVKVRVITFGTTIQKTAEFTSIKELTSYLKGLVYDGATDLSILRELNLTANLVLLFSDGILSLNPTILPLNNIVIPVVSSLEADYALLSSICNSSVLNLSRLSTKESVAYLETPKIEIKKPVIKGVENLVYSINSSNELIISGKIKEPRTSIDIEWIQNNTSLGTQTIEITPSDLRTIKLDASRLWAKNQIAEWSVDINANKQKIIDLAVEYKIVTDYTSLIVLETIEDYIRYDITPPVELQTKEYLDRVKYKNTNNSVNSNSNNSKSAYEILSNDKSLYYNAILSWWNRDFVVSELKYSSGEDLFDSQRTQTTSSTPETSTTTSGTSNIAAPTVYTGDRITVSGTVSDDNGEPIVGSTVVVKGTNTGTITDVDGRYTLSCPSDAILSFQYVGFVSKEFVATSAGDVTLDEESMTLEDAVVVSYSMMAQHHSVYDDNAVQRRTSVSTSSSSNARRTRDTDMEMVDPAQNERQASQTTTPQKAYVALRPWNSGAEYLTSFKNKDTSDLYSHYLSVRDNYLTTPSFFVDVADIFMKKGVKDKALRILSNIVEIKKEDINLVRIYGQKLIEYGDYNEAVKSCKYAVKLRSNEPQSFRDLALAYDFANQPQEAFENFLKVVTKKWNRFDEMKSVVFVELNSLLSRNPNLVLEKALGEYNISLKEFNSIIVADIPVHSRIVLSWDTDNCDIDLHVTDPSGEKCYYGHQLTKNGGRISKDFINGLGPEEYMIKTLLPGVYTINTDYYGSQSQSMLMPVTVYADIFTNYGKPNQKRERIVLRLSSKKEYIEVGRVKIE